MFFSIPIAFSILQAISAVNAAYTPRGIHARHAALLRARSPAPVPAPLVEPVIRKRDSKKCRPRPSSSSIAPSSTPVAPVDPASDPNAPSSSSQVTTHTPTSTSSNPPQSHTTQKAPPPPPPPTTTKSSPPPTHTSSGGGSSGGGGGGSDPFGSFYSGVQTGQLTFYELGLTACGQTFTDADMVCAVSHTLFDAVPGAGANPNNNPVCGKQVRVTYQGKSIVVSVVDRCAACKPTDLDLSPDAFSQLASQSIGRLSDATWEWV